MTADLEKKVRFRQAVERLLAAHFLSYPVGFAWACAAMPVAIWIYRDALLGLEENTLVLGNFIVTKVAWPAIASMLLVHLAGVPWAFERAPKGPRRRWFLRACAALAALAVLVGGSGWVWIHTR